MAPRAPIRSSLVTTMLRAEVDRVIPKVFDRWGVVNALVVGERIVPSRRKHAATEKYDLQSMVITKTGRFDDDEPAQNKKIKVGSSSRALRFPPRSWIFPIMA